MMKRLVGYSSLFAIAAGSFPSNAIANRAEQVIATSQVEESGHHTEVVIDPRIELLGVIQILSGYFLRTRLDTDYNRDVQRYFAAQANHRAVQIFRDMSKADFQFSYVPTAIFAYSAPPDLAEEKSVPEAAMRAAGGQEKLLLFMSAMRDFYRDSRFDQFQASHTPAYRTQVAAIQPTVQAVVDRLETYLGKPLGRSTVVLGPLLHDGGFAATYNNPDGSLEVVAFIGPESVINGQADFGSVERMDSLISHEFAHSVINPLTAKHQASVDALRSRFEPIGAAMAQNGYTKWDVAVYEHIIRAITARLAGLSRGQAAEEAAVNEEVKRGFLYVPALIERLKEYEARRATYPDMDSFFPELIEAFDQVPATDASDRSS